MQGRGHLDFLCKLKSVVPSRKKLADAICGRFEDLGFQIEVRLILRGTHLQRGPSWMPFFLALVYISEGFAVASFFDIPEPLDRQCNSFVGRLWLLAVVSKRMIKKIKSPLHEAVQG